MALFYSIYGSTLVAPVNCIRQEEFYAEFYR